MWKTFTDFADTFTDNVDDFAIVVFIIIVGNKLAALLYSFLRDFMKMSKLTAQSAKTITQGFVFVVCFTQLIGGNVLQSAAGGIAIGVGYAFQPYIIAVFNGLMIHNDHSIIENHSWLTIERHGIDGAKVMSIGLFNTELEKDGATIILSNSMLSSSALVVHKSDPAVAVTLKRRNTAAIPDPYTNNHHAMHYAAHSVHHS